MEDRFKSFTFLIHSIAKKILKIKTEEMMRLNLKSVHVTCLYYLYKDKEITAKELSVACGEDKAAISRSIDYLEKQGLVCCDSISEKRYKSKLELTAMGKEIGCFVAQKIDTMVNLASEGISEEYRGILYECLAMIDKNLENILKELK